MKDVIDSIRIIIYRMLAARGLLKVLESICGSRVTSDSPTVTRKLEVVYTVKETFNIELPAEPWTSSGRTILIEEILRALQLGIKENKLSIYLCQDNKQICSICGWHLEEFYSCSPCNDPCTNCDIIPQRPTVSRCG